MIFPDEISVQYSNRYFCVRSFYELDGDHCMCGRVDGVWSVPNTMISMGVCWLLLFLGVVNCTFSSFHLFKKKYIFFTYSALGSVDGH